MDNPQITIQQGTLKGILGTDLNERAYYSFFGIPYAKPPVGTLRFKAPQPPEKWIGIRDATFDTGACYAKDDYQPTIRNGSEDCLVLNVYTPELPNTKSILKPVMVYIHGGGFVTGSNNSREYGPQFLITENVVIVSINYRLGILGFLVIDDPNLGVPGNAALKDMVMALKWIQGNIKHFGGDPNSVTIFGESAGAAAVEYLMISPLAKGLFHKVIAQSGSVLCPWALAKPSTKELAQILGCSATIDAEILEYLQSLPVKQLYDGQEGLGDRYAVNFVRPIGPVIEKITPNEPAFLSEHPLDILVNGNYNKVPLVMGYTNLEGLIFDVPSDMYDLEIKDFEELILPSLKLERTSDLSKAVAKKIKKFYYGNEEPSEKNKIKQYTIQSDAHFVYGIQQSIKHHAFNSTQPVYFYRFSVEGDLNFVKVLGKIDLPGAAHADDLGYLFRTFITPDNLKPDSKEVKTVRKMVKLWANFARTGNPNTVEDVIWEPVTRDKLNCLDIREDLVLIVNPEQEGMKFWNNVLK